MVHSSKNIKNVRGLGQETVTNGSVLLGGRVHAHTSLSIYPHFEATIRNFENSRVEIERHIYRTEIHQNTV
jgi:hypothetical protein